MNRTVRFVYACSRQVMEKIHMKIMFLLFVFPDHVTPQNQTREFDWTVCASRDQPSCHCSSDVMTNVIFKCQITNISYLDAVINTPGNVERLNLSGNRIHSLSRGSFFSFTNMIYLCLASNNIHTIGYGAFGGLTKLLEIDLSDNNITQWNTSAIEKDLPNLRFLNVENNNFWIPDHGILSLQNLQGIFLIFTKILYIRRQLRCYVIKHEKLRNESRETLISKLEKPNLSLIKSENPNQLLSKLLKDFCETQELVFRNSDFLDALGVYEFRFECVIITYLHDYVRKPVTLPNITKGWKFNIFQVDTCWTVIGFIQVITTLAAILSLVFNVIVILTTSRSRILRESVAHVLVANIAVGDLLVSLYMITIVSTRQSMSKEEFIQFYLPYFCSIVGLFFLVGQISSPLMSFVMTLERYLAVVYCMRPHIRITRRMCNAAMVTMWSLSLSIAISFMTSKQFSERTNNMCVPKTNTSNINVLMIVGTIGVLLYILSIALYLHMYLDFRKTNQKTVQLQRENRFARRVALIMFTNVFFFILPLMISTAIKITPLEHKVSNRAKALLWSTLAVTCLGINSFLNPILFSFRNEKFRTEFRKRVLLCNNAIGNQSES